MRQQKRMLFPDYISKLILQKGCTRDLSYTLTQLQKDLIIEMYYGNPPDFSRTASVNANSVAKAVGTNPLYVGRFVTQYMKSIGQKGQYGKNGVAAMTPLRKMRLIQMDNWHRTRQKVFEEPASLTLTSPAAKSTTTTAYATKVLTKATSDNSSISSGIQYGFHCMWSFKRSLESLADRVSKDTSLFHHLGEASQVLLPSLKLTNLILFDRMRILLPFRTSRKEKNNHNGAAK